MFTMKRSCFSALKELFMFARVPVTKTPGGKLRSVGFLPYFGTEAETVFSGV